MLGSQRSGNAVDPPGLAHSVAWAASSRDHQEEHEGCAILLAFPGVLVSSPRPPLKSPEGSVLREQGLSCRSWLGWTLGTGQDAQQGLSSTVMNDTAVLQLLKHEPAFLRRTQAGRESGARREAASFSPASDGGGQG